MNHIKGNRNTALMAAAKSGYLDCVRELINAGADLNTQDENGYTALMLAALAQSNPCIVSLIMAGAEVEPALKLLPMKYYISIDPEGRKTPPFNRDVKFISK